MARHAIFALAMGVVVLCMARKDQMAHLPAGEPVPVPTLRWSGVASSPAISTLGRLRVPPLGCY